MIYWVLHKKLTDSDWKNWLEGNPCYFSEKIKNFTFIDISSCSWFAKIENIVLKKELHSSFDFSIISKPIIYISNKKDFNCLKVSQNDLFIFQSYNNPRIFAFNKILNYHKCKTLLLNHWQLPIIKKNPQQRNCNWIINKIVKLDKKILLMRFFYKIYMKTTNIRSHYDYIFSCGTKVLKNIPEYISYDKILPCHSVPYDEFLEQKKGVAKDNIMGKYFVFVDQALTIHPDNKGLEKFTEKYHKEILLALDNISKKNGNIRIVIAQHPRIQFENGFWNNYETFSGKTAELILNSCGVIGHFSTSLILAFLAKKEIFFLKSSSSYFSFNKSVEYLQDAIGGKLYDMNKNKLILEKNSSKINPEDYFSLCNTSDKKNQEIFLDFFSKFDTP